LGALFVVVTFLGAFLGWLGVQLKWSNDRDEALRWIRDFRARQIAAEKGSPLPARGYYVSHVGIKAPRSLRIFGASGVERLEVYQDCLSLEGRYSLADLRRLFPEAEVTAVTRPPPRPTQQGAGKEWLIMADEPLPPASEEP